MAPAVDTQGVLMSGLPVVWIHSDSETPRRGSGLRRVRVKIEGLWVRLYPVQGPGDPDKVHLETYRLLLRE